MSISSIGGWRYLDESSNLIFPWYTKPFLEHLISLDISNWKVFEYGCGDSTFWWRNNAKEVISVDSDYSWAQKTNCHFSNDKSEFINFPKKFISEELFDCVIIDGEPVSWRDECTPVALECLKPGGMLIIDNYLQGSVKLEKWINVENLLNNNYNQIFQEPEHGDWKTAYWIK